MEGRELMLQLIGKDESALAAFTAADATEGRNLLVTLVSKSTDPEDAIHSVVAAHSSPPGTNASSQAKPGVPAIPTGSLQASGAAMQRFDSTLTPSPSSLRSSSKGSKP